MNSQLSSKTAIKKKYKRKQVQSETKYFPDKKKLGSEWQLTLNIYEHLFHI